MLEQQNVGGEGSAAVIERRQSIALMLNEEDHLRMQSIRPGMSLRAAYESLATVDEELEQSLELAFDHELGYLTTCPTNLGTGMRASASGETATSVASRTGRR